MKSLPFAGFFAVMKRELLKLTLLRGCALVLAMLTAAVYLPYVHNPPVFDDYNVIKGANLFDYAYQFWISPRWFPYATLAHTHLLTDGSIAALRLGNLLLHCANVIAVLVLLRELCLASLDVGHNGREKELRALAVGLLAASLFAVHPLAVYGVGYLVQRSILMSTLFMVLMLICYLRWFTSGRQVLWVWSAIWYALSVFSKEHSIMAPAVALALTLTLSRLSLDLLRRLFLPFLVYAAIAIPVILMVKGVFGRAYEPHALEMIAAMPDPFGDFQKYGYGLSIVTQMCLFFKYLALFVFPNPMQMSIDIRVPLAASFYAWPYWAAVIGFVVYPIVCTCMLLKGGRIGITGWALLYPWLMFATELTAIRVQEPFVLYRTYLWFPVLGVALVLALYHLVPYRAVLFGVAAIILAIPMSWNRLHSMSDELLLWEDAAKQLVHGDEPGAGRIYYNRAIALFAARKSEAALADMTRVVALHPDLAPVYSFRASIFMEMKQFQPALLDFSRAIMLSPDRADFYLARGAALKKLGREAEALVDVQKSCEMKNPFACFVAQQTGVAKVTGH